MAHVDDTRPEARFRHRVKYVPFRYALAAYLILAAGNVTGLVWQYTLANDTRTSLCAFKGDLERRVTAGEEFLLKHPNGIPGISAENIQTSLNNQRMTITALESGGLECSDKEEEGANGK